VQLPHERIDLTLPSPNCAEGDDLRTICLGTIGDGDGLLMDIHPDVERARL
jgi:hypothetical protein